MDGVQPIVPESPEPFPRFVGRARLPPSGHQFEGTLTIPALSQNEHHFVLGVGGEIQMDLERRAGIPSGLHVACETPALQRRRPSQRALAPDELRAIGCDAVGVAARRQERNAIRELRLPGISREDRALACLVLGHQGRVRLPWRCAEDPLGVVGDGQPSGTAPVIPHVKPNDFHGLIRWHKDQEILREPVAV